MNGKILLNGEEQKLYKVLHNQDNNLVDEDKKIEAWKNAISSRNNLVDPEKTINQYGSTPAHIAVYQGLPRLLEAVLVDGVNPNKKTPDSKTALHQAVESGENLIDILLNHNADIHEKNWKGQTPLDLAREKYPENHPIRQKLQAAEDAYQAKQLEEEHTQKKRKISKQDEAFETLWGANQPIGPNNKSLNNPWEKNQYNSNTEELINTGLNTSNPEPSSNKSKRKFTPNTNNSNELNSYSYRYNNPLNNPGNYGYPNLLGSNSSSNFITPQALNNTNSFPNVIKAPNIGSPSDLAIPFIATGLAVKGIINTLSGAFSSNKKRKRTPDDNPHNNEVELHDNNSSAFDELDNERVTRAPRIEPGTPLNSPPLTPRTPLDSPPVTPNHSGESTPANPHFNLPSPRGASPITPIPINLPEPHSPIVPPAPLLVVPAIQPVLPPAPPANPEIVVPTPIRRPRANETARLVELTPGFGVETWHEGSGRTRGSAKKGSGKRSRGRGN